ncbi:MAG: type II toxin-antitoxin system RelE/ParE family toxin [Caldilineaceae bacterium]
MYRLKLSELAWRQLKAIPSDYLRSEILDEMEALLDEPYPVGSQLEDELTHRLRLKINGWRIIYKVDEADQLITVLTIRKRNRNTYLNVP